MSQGMALRGLTITVQRSIGLPDWSTWVRIVAARLGRRVRRELPAPTARSASKPAPTSPTRMECIDECQPGSCYLGRPPRHGSDPKSGRSRKDDAGGSGHPTDHMGHPVDLELAGADHA
ncbi:hypothetical protein D3C71_1313720 [compost metagenome]